MKLSLIICLIISQVFFIATISCSENDDKPDTCAKKQTHLNQLRKNIEDLAQTSICNADSECRYVAFGIKPCGGPWEYLIYTTSIDTLELKNLVIEYNNLEAKFNQECDAISDCMMVMPPTSFNCTNNSCIPIY
ncbi:MAG: hypothetical protein ABI295_10615 [Xanthomarina sp.]